MASYFLHCNQVRPRHRSLLGAKCFNLAHYRQQGLSIPPLFALTKVAAREIIQTGNITPQLEKGILLGVKDIEKDTTWVFGSEKDPLVFAVRSGDPKSMYGALLTIPSVGLNDRTYKGLIKRFGPRSSNAVLWLYLDLIVDFALRVEGIQKERIRPLLEKMKHKDKSEAEVKDLIYQAKNLKRDFGVPFRFPQNVKDQLLATIKAVACSWESVEAKCAAASLGLGKEETLSVFFQEMKFSGLTQDSAFVSFLTHPGPFGIYAPSTFGRRVMFGTLTNGFDLERFKLRDPQSYSSLMRQARSLVMNEHAPLNLEVVIEQGCPYIVQIGRAALSPAVYIEAINLMVEEGIIQEAEAIRKMADEQIQKKIKTYKLDPAADLRLIAKGTPGADGAVFGKVAISVEQAIEFAEEQENVVFVSTIPHDDEVYQLTVGGKIKGIVASYGIGRSSHIADFAQANAIPMVASVKDMRVADGGGEVIVGGKTFLAGDRIIIDGARGDVYISLNDRGVVEDKTFITRSYGIDFRELLRSMENRFQSYTYEEILKEHGKEVKLIEELVRKASDPQERAMLQAHVHCLHLLAYKKGKKLGKTEHAVNADVAVADGNFDRVEGFEDKGFLIEESGDKFIIITGGEVYYDGNGLEEGITDVSDIVSAAGKKGVELKQYHKSQKLTTHTQEVVTIGIIFPKNQLSEVLEFLKNYFLKK